MVAGETLDGDVFNVLARLLWRLIHNPALSEQPLIDLPIPHFQQSLAFPLAVLELTYILELVGPFKASAMGFVAPELALVVVVGPLEYSFAFEFAIHVLAFVGEGFIVEKGLYPIALFHACLECPFVY